MTISAIKHSLKSCGVNVSPDDPENQDLPIEDNCDLPNKGRGIKGHVCIKKLQGMKDKEKRRRKGNINRMKKNSKNCKKTTCLKLYSKKVDGGFHCGTPTINNNSFLASFPIFYTQGITSVVQLNIL